MPRSTRQTGVILCLVATAGSIACSSDKSTSPSILDIVPGTPASWGLVGTNSPTYVVGTDRATVHSGGTALAIAGTDTSRLRFSGVGQFVKADNYLGKRVRLSAWVRHQEVVGSDHASRRGSHRRVDHEPAD